MLSLFDYIEKSTWVMSTFLLSCFLCTLQFGEGELPIISFIKKLQIVVWYSFSNGLNVLVITISESMICHNVFHKIVTVNSVPH